MKPLEVKLLEPDSTDMLRALSRGIGRFIFAASVLFILFAGTFPFDFSFTLKYATPVDWRLMQYDPYFVDRGQNILFFLPFGFGFASLIRTRANRSKWRMFVTPMASFVLSGLIEASQKFVSFRDPTIVDLWCNAVGGIIGAAVYVRFGDRMLASIARGMMRMQRFARPAIVGSLAAAYGLFHLSAPLLLHDPGDLSVWDPTLSLVVGNEVSGNRPWNGTVNEILLADRAIGSDEALSLAAGTAPKGLLGTSLLGHYQPKGNAPYPDLTQQLPPLTWATTPTTQPFTGAPPIDADHWLTTSSPVTSANQRIMQSSQLTFAATVVTASLDQRGPARLASISGGTSLRNIQLAQEFAYLVVRIRSAVRSIPDLYIHDVFVPDVPRHIVVTSKAAESIVYVDGKEEGRIHITPEAKVIWRLYPREFRIRLDKYGFRSYAAIYRAIVFIPFASLLGATLMLLAWNRIPKPLLAIIAILGMAVVLELVLHHLGGKIEVINFLISLIIGFGTLGGLMLWRRVREHGE